MCYYTQWFSVQRIREAKLGVMVRPDLTERVSASSHERTFAKGVQFIKQGISAVMATEGRHGPVTRVHVLPPPQKKKIVCFCVRNWRIVYLYQKLICC